MKKYKPLFLVLVAMAALAAGVFVLKSKHTEATFADGAQDPRWGHMPLTVYVGEDLAPWKDAIEGAARIWNGRVGCELLRFTGEPQADVRFKSDDGAACDGPTSDRPGAAATTHFCGGGIDVVTRRLDSLRDAGPIMVHETGHVLGLAHDREGAMREAPEVWGVGDPPDWWLPSVADVAALKERYCAK